MSRSDEVNKMTENIYKFNPSLKIFVSSGKLYEKALTGVMVAAKGYFDAMVKLGELASDSQGSKEQGEYTSENNEKEHLKLFHSELLSQLEHKLELDNKYLTSTLKKYQRERKTRTDSIEHCQSQLKKLRRKSQASHHPNKYSDREMQFVEQMSRHQGELDALVAVGFRSALTEERRRYCFLVDRHCAATKVFINYHCKVRELLSQKLSSWQQSCSQPTRLPDRALHLFRHTAPQAAGAAGIAELLRQAKLGAAQPLEQRLSVQEVQPLLNAETNPRTQRASPSSQSETPPTHNYPGPQMSRPLSMQSNHTPQHTPSHMVTGASSGNGHINTSTTLSHAQPTTPSNTSSLSHNAPVPTTVSSGQCFTASPHSVQGTSVSQNTPHSPPGSRGAPLSRALTPVPHQEGFSSTPPSHNPLLMKAAELYATSTLPLPRRPISEARLGYLGGTLPRVLPVASPIRVEALFPHVPGAGEVGGGGFGGTCLLHFLPGDTVMLLISEPRDGWHYGQNERTGRKGWFPFSYTQPYPAPGEHENSSPLFSKINSASTGYLDKLGSPGVHQLSAEMGEDQSTPSPRASYLRPRPYSMANPDTAQNSAECYSPPPSPTRTNPFAHVRLRKAVTNDRSAPLIQSED
ncbi:hypothetical protein AAFF_G00119820 [Aldrovandia affinis]|uniref:Brain-specific angiogenesis inhibitor 1-associated protein 2 n=1 Tax=Aldrovandia affinis TaxID=143900 RepID=A0AAD7WB41_9TELE|nr:hypothetical protein AAFF_G00119820 [Aldrovandia affinis]